MNCTTILSSVRAMLSPWRATNAVSDNTNETKQNSVNEHVLDDELETTKMAERFLSSDCLELLSDELLSRILGYCHFDEFNLILMTRPTLTRTISLADVLMSFEEGVHFDFVRFEEYIQREYWGPRLHLPSAHRLCRILTTRTEGAVCETCGNTDSIKR